MISYFKYALTTLTLITFYNICICAAKSDNNGAVNISLSDYDPLNNSTQVFNTTTNLNYGNILEISVSNVHPWFLYFIIQIHSFQLNTFLSYNLDFTSSSTVNGTNIGLVQQVDGSKEYQFYVKSEDGIQSNMILILVIPYPDDVPIPGGCNMEYMVETAPYQRISYTDDLITVDAQSASVDGFSCEDFLVNYDMYHMYLPERNYSPQTYFKELQKMITVENILKYGTEVYKPIPNRLLRRLYNSYRGTGSIYALVAKFQGKGAAYVPITTYSCDALNWVDSCDVPRNHFSRFLCGSIFFLGLFACYFGHRFFKTEMFLIGSLFGGYFVYTGLTYSHILTESDTLITSASLAILFGLLWLMFWWYCGIPVLSILLVVTALGFIIASILSYALLGDINIFQSDLVYWGFLFGFILMTIIVTIGFTYKANIVACSILGAYAVIIPIDHYIGSNMKYIIINVIRRVTVENFESAVLSPPYQTRDIILTVLWASLTITGMAYQFLRQKGRPPFPPTPTHAERLPRLGERTPLLQRQLLVATHATNAAQMDPNRRPTV